MNTWISTGSASSVSEAALDAADEASDTALDAADEASDAALDAADEASDTALDAAAAADDAVDDALEAELLLPQAASENTIAPASIIANTLFFIISEILLFIS